MMSGKLIEAANAIAKERAKAIAKERAKAIAKERAKAKDNFIAVYLNEHPKLSIDDIELVEEQMPVAEGYLGMKYRWYCRPKESEDEG
ncbi:MAG: hypothetical protein SVT56_01840 [Chloroflexota bacterium]|nr:hypothetical protein [Chloroflexota bacterium]